MSDPADAVMLPSPAEMGVADRASAVPVAILMQAAGRAVARAARRFGPCRTLVLCGPGNNGGDGEAAAAMLAECGWPVAVARFGRKPPQREAAGVVAVGFVPAEAARAELVIDAVFGAGLRDALPEAVADTLQAARRVLAVDVPSGLDGGTGRMRGRGRGADVTVTFARLKPGHLLLPGRTLCGETILAEIGLPDAALAAAGVRTWRNDPRLFTLPRPAVDGHKYGRGHLVVVGGAAMTGAARLAAASARRGGTGLVTIAAPHGDPRATDIYRAGDPGVIVSDAVLADLLEDARLSTWVVGPGLGAADSRSVLPALVAAGRTIVADADALTAHAGATDVLSGCAVLTPHEGEFARLFGKVGPDKLAAVRTAAAALGTVVLLKGADTVIAAPDGRAAINADAPPSLATAGAGDVLAGLIGALLAQGMAPWPAACAGVWLHGDAARRAGPGLIAEDLPYFIAQAIAHTLQSQGARL